jgi:hypothetical protein
MIATKSDQTQWTTTQPIGPQLSTAESGAIDQGVHIIFVPTDVAGGLDGERITPAGQAALRPYIGNPAITDVIVYACRPWHFAGNELQPHPEVHTRFPRTILEVHRDGPAGPERAVWWSEHDFRITIIEDEAVHESREASKTTTPAVDAYPYPFEQKPMTRPEEALDHRQIFVARSTVPVTAGRYKISFEIEGQSIDPNMHCL